MSSINPTRVGRVPDFDAVTHDHVLAALEEYDERGADVFLNRYGFGKARDYVLWHDGKSYDSKAILGVAHKYATGAAAARSEFSGGKDGAAKILRGLGFAVTFADDLPDDGGVTALAPLLAASRERSREARPRTRPIPTCPTCFTELPATGSCDYCS